MLKQLITTEAGVPVSAEGEDTPVAAPEEKVSAIYYNTPNGARAYLLTYYSNGKLAGITAGDEMVLLHYGKNAYSRCLYEKNKLKEKTQASLTEKGLLRETATIVYDDGGTPLSTERAQYVYNEQEQLIQQLVSPGSGPANMISYAWYGGDCMASSERESFTYFPDKTVQEGDLLRIFQLLNYGHVYIRNRQLIRSWHRSDKHTVSYDYEFDKQNRIRKIILKNHLRQNSSSITLQYPSFI